MYNGARQFFQPIETFPFLNLLKSNWKNTHQE